ncbi:uncharacterized protein LOC129597388 [Paramacrobiotus metropolitanus]|uniref:uncharacterized protein LOC129597388 n=1 Tax=Paramacrobiotus metropolitanus TaxID=2943436 RepID=UPI002445874C|nr:uncharacterized protein LOC129597388 [Paramacrobiotus metropolitanus]
MMHQFGYRILLFCLSFGMAYSVPFNDADLSAPSFTVPYNSLQIAIFNKTSPAPHPTFYYAPVATLLPDATEIFLDPASGTNCVFVEIKLWDKDYVSAIQDAVIQRTKDPQTVVSLIPFQWTRIEYAPNSAAPSFSNSSISWQPFTSTPLPPTLSLCIRCQTPAACNETKTALQSDSARFASHLFVSFSPNMPAGTKTIHTATANTGKSVANATTPSAGCHNRIQPESPFDRPGVDMVTVHWQARRADNLYAFSDAVIVVTLRDLNDKPFNSTNVTTTPLSGEFTLRLPRTKDYNILFETSGFAGYPYAPITLRNFTQVLSLGREVFMEPLMFTRSELKGIGKAMGAIRLVNTSGAYSMSGVQVQLRAGINNVTGPIAANTTTINGTWSVPLPGGPYTAVAVYTGSKPDDKFAGPPFTVQAVPGGWDNMRDWALTPQFAKGDVRIVLRATGLIANGNYGPFDVKLMVKGPLQNNPIQRAEVNANVTVSADKLMVYDYMDRIFGSVLIKKQLSGTYRIFVQETDALRSKPETRWPEWNLANSQATVEIYRGDTLWAQYFVPISSGNTWTVAEINEKRLNVINEMGSVK